MNNSIESLERYRQAQKQGRRVHRQCVHEGKYPYLQVMDEILTDSMTVGETEIGLVDIPTEQIVGTKTRGRTNAFASNFMPLLGEDSEFGRKWRKLCEAHLSDEGIRDPIVCYEYLGRFYVAEGNKRVSVLKYFGASSIPGRVIRVMPASSDAQELRLYNEFLRFYPLMKLYSLNFSKTGSFAKLQAALGYESDHQWTAEERRRFLSGYFYFRRAYGKLGGESLSTTVGDALLVWLKVYPFDSLRSMSAEELASSLNAVWKDIKSLGSDEAVKVNTEANESGEKNILTKFVSSIIPPHLNIAFIHELSPETSNWVRAHERGREQLERVLGDRISTQCFCAVGREEGAEDAMEKAVKNGADVIFTTTASLIGACRRIAARHPHVKILNCSISMPYTGVRTYYSRIYEGKFISGAIAGAMSDGNNIGYIASYPIFGVPAGINAFALGAQLTNPRARIQLKWSCTPGDHINELICGGVDFISTLDIPMPGWEAGKWGTFQVLADGSTRLIGSPYWDWGEFYVKLVRQILKGEWESDTSAAKEGKAVNYWWGMSSGVIGVEYTEALPGGVKTLAEFLRKGIIKGDINPFQRRIVSQDGMLRNDGDSIFTPEELLHMDWLCENVDGSIPEYEEILPRSQGIVRLQGIYRDRIAPVKEDILL